MVLLRYRNCAVSQSRPSHFPSKQTRLGRWPQTLSPERRQTSGPKISNSCCKAYKPKWGVYTYTITATASNKRVTAYPGFGPAVSMLHLQAIWLCRTLAGSSSAPGSPDRFIHRSIHTPDHSGCWLHYVLYLAVSTITSPALRTRPSPFVCESGQENQRRYMTD